MYVPKEKSPSGHNTCSTRNSTVWKHKDPQERENGQRGNKEGVRGTCRKITGGWSGAGHNPKGPIHTKGKHPPAETSVGKGYG